MQHSDAAEALPGHFLPDLRPTERTVAQVDGWILGLGQLLAIPRAPIAFA
jgi:hypothetical protein